MDRLRVLTLNIWHREAPWERRLAVIRAGIEQLAPDIIGLQEVLELKVDGQRRDQAMQIADGLGYESVYGRAQTLGPGLEFGNALLSRHPIVHSEVVALPGSESGESRCVLHARVQTSHGEQPVFVTHLNWKLHHGSIRIAQLLALVALVEDRVPIDSTLPPIIMGDFNAEPESDEIRFMRGFHCLEGKSVFFADAWAYGGAGGPGFTFDRRNPYAARSHEPPRRIDYIFVRGPDRDLRGEPLGARVVFDEPVDGVWASDHFGLFAELSATKQGVRSP